MSDTVYRKKGKPLSIDDSLLVIQVFQQCNKEREQSNPVQTLDAHSRTANYTGVGRRQVVEIIQHFKETGNVLPSPLAGNRTVHRTNIPPTVEENIRQFIFGKHLLGIVKQFQSHSRYSFLKKC